MRALACALLCVTLAMLAGCATTKYGSFVEHPPRYLTQQIADDTIKQMVTLFAPAGTRLELTQPTPDPFGKAFVKGLRTKGYALLEFNPDKDGTSQRPATMSATSLPLRYVLDRLTHTSLYRITVIIGHQSISRSYVLKGGKIIPAAWWTHRK